MTRPSPVRSTPPCGQVCWEWVAPNAWTYIDGHDKCGHRFDTEAGIWRWHEHPTAQETK